MKNTLLKLSVAGILLTSFATANENLDNLSLNKVINTVNSVKIEKTRPNIDVDNYVNEKLKMLQEDLVKKGLTPGQAEIAIIEQIEKKEKELEKDPLKNTLEKEYEATANRIKKNYKEFEKLGNSIGEKAKMENIIRKHDNDFVKLVKVPAIPKFLNECVSYDENIRKIGNVKNVHVRFIYKTGYKKKISQILSIINELQLNNSSCRFYTDSLKQSGQVYTLKEDFVCKLNNKNSIYIKRLNNLLTNNINYDKIFNKYKKRMDREFFILQQLMNRIFNPFMKIN